MSNRNSVCAKFVVIFLCMSIYTSLNTSYETTKKIVKTSKTIWNWIKQPKHDIKVHLNWYKIWGAYNFWRIIVILS